MSTVRKRSAAGLFYPDDAHELRAEVDRLLRDARMTNGSAPRAMIQPHAGYTFSGPVAAFGYRRLSTMERVPTRVVVLGPNHTVPLDSIAVTEADEWETPLGSVQVDVELRAKVLDLRGVHASERPHLTEHAIEVHLPFLQRVLQSGWKLLPLVVGDIAPETVAEVIDACGDEQTIIIVSTDLSHYHSYSAARQIDDITVDEIVGRTITAIGPRQACGYSPLRGLLASTMIEDLAVEVLDVRNSGDTAGDRHRVVGYASIVFC